MILSGTENEKTDAMVRQEMTNAIRHNAYASFLKFLGWNLVKDNICKMCKGNSANKMGSVTYCCNLSYQFRQMVNL